MEALEIKAELINVLHKESNLLDEILKHQDAVHECVRKRNWIELENLLAALQIMSEDFVELDNKRSELSENADISRDFEVTPALSSVRSKLSKSKLQNKVLNEYISTTKSFLQGIFDEVLPERRNITYSRYGKIVKGELHNVVVNQVV